MTGFCDGENTKAPHRLRGLRLSIEKLSAEGAADEVAAVLAAWVAHDEDYVANPLLTEVLTMSFQGILRHSVGIRHKSGRDAMALYR